HARRWTHSSAGTTARRSSTPFSIRDWRSVMIPTRQLRAAFVLLAIAPLSRAGILTVGPAGSGAQFTQIQAAVNAAYDDDVILVQPGTYPGSVVGTPLRILGDGTGVVRIADAPPCVTVRGIGAPE